MNKQIISFICLLMISSRLHAGHPNRDKGVIGSHKAFRLLFNASSSFIRPDIGPDETFSSNLPASSRSHSKSSASSTDDSSSESFLSARSAGNSSNASNEPKAPKNEASDARNATSDSSSSSKSSGRRIPTSKQFAGAQAFRPHRGLVDIGALEQTKFVIGTRQCMEDENDIIRQGLTHLTTIIRNRNLDDLDGDDQYECDLTLHLNCLMQLPEAQRIALEALTERLSRRDTDSSRKSKITDDEVNILKKLLTQAGRNETVQEHLLGLRYMRKPIINHFYSILDSNQNQQNQMINHLVFISDKTQRLSILEKLLEELEVNKRFEAVLPWYKRHVGFVATGAAAVGLWARPCVEKGVRHIAEIGLRAAFAQLITAVNGNISAATSAAGTTK